MDKQPGGHIPYRLGLHDEQGLQFATTVFARMT
jgi:hypothetical protein